MPTQQATKSLPLLDGRLNTPDLPTQHCTALNGMIPDLLYPTLNLSGQTL